MKYVTLPVHSDPCPVQQCDTQLLTWHTSEQWLRTAGTLYDESRLCLFYNQIGFSPDDSVVRGSMNNHWELPPKK